jgi:hypothetical protein
LNKRAKLEKEEICNFFAKWFPVSLQERARGSFSYEELFGIFLNNKDFIEKNNTSRRRER